MVVPSVKAQKDPIAHVPANASIYPNVFLWAEEHVSVFLAEPLEGRSVEDVKTLEAVPLGKLDHHCASPPWDTGITNLRCG